MAKVIKLRKGLDVKLKGTAALETTALKMSDEYALCPDDFCGVKPKPVVKEGDAVKVGDALFVDKLHPEVKFVSPVSGVVSQIERGDRRKLLSIRVKADGMQTARKFDVKGDVKAVMMESGLFGMMLQRPYAVVPNPDDKPKAIFVSAFNSMPLAQNFEYVLEGQEKDFQTGISTLSKLSRVHLGVGSKQKAKALLEAKDCEVTVFDGPAPAGNVGVQINHIDPVNKGEVVWTMAPEVVIMLGRLMNNGEADFTRKVAVAGSEVKNPGYVKVILGAKLSDILEGRIDKAANNRIIDGNVMTGMKSDINGFLGAQSTEVNVIPEGDDADEMLGWIMPRFNQFSVSRTYFSWLMPKKEYRLDARVKGGERHMIFSGEYDKVFPMDIYAGYLIKAIITEDIDRQEALGIYEVAPEDFALAEFVCSSKLELQRIVRQGLDALRKENM